MNRDKRITLYDAITNLPDHRLEEALPLENAHKKERARKGLAPLAACLALLLLFGAWDMGFFGHRGGAGGGGTGEVYMFYAGPVFPLSAAEDTRLRAERAVDFDFSPYAPRAETWETPDGTVEEAVTWDEKALVTDSYTLTSPEEGARNVTLLYPFAASLGDSRELLPALTVNGEGVEAALLPGSAAEACGDRFDGDPEAADQRWALADPSSWTSYRTLIEAGYQDWALAGYEPDLDRPVTVYRLTDCAPPKGFEGDFYDLAVTYRRQVPVLSYGFNFGRNDLEAGTFLRGCSLAPGRSPSVPPTLIVLSGDLGDCAVKAWADGGMTVPLEGASWTLEREETTLAEALVPLAEDFCASYLRDQNGDGTLLALFSQAQRRDLMARQLYDDGLLTDDPTALEDSGMLEEAFGRALGADRILYLSFEATVPAGEGTEVSAFFAKPASRDFKGKDRDRNGYDLVTGLGSSLRFTKQTASVSHLDWVEITDQSFGFDPAAGVTAVTLDPDREHYFLEVVRRTEK